MPASPPSSTDANPRTAPLLAQRDWSATPLGPRAQWPAQLKTLVGLMLRSKAPQHLVWGPEQVLLYNDGYIPVLGGRHPAAFGMRFAEVWPDIWDGVEPIVRRTYAGEASRHEDHPWLLDRGDHREQVWISFAYTPVEGDDGAVLGFHCSFHETTATVLAERTRAQELDRLRAMFEQAPGFVALLSGPDHVFTLANAAYMRLVGGRDVLGQPVARALPETVGQGFIALLDHVYASGERYVGSRVPIDLADDHGDVQRRYLDFLYQPVRDAAGAITGIFVQGADVTAQFHTEEELRAITEAASAAALEAEADRARLGALLQAAPVGIGYAGPDGRLQLVNQANYDLWGAFPLAKPVEEYDYWRAWWADGSPRHGQRLAAQDWGLARALAGEDVAGEVTGGVVAQVDISDRVAAEARLRESEARFRTIADAMPQMVWSTRADGWADYFNRQWYAFTGLPDGACDGFAWVESLHPDDRARAAAHWAHCAATGELYEIEYRMRHHSGEYRWVLGRGLPVRDAEGRVIRWMGTCTDIHGQKLARAALEQSEAALRQADRRKDEFLAMLAHELRNPLAPIRTAAEVIALPGTSPARMREAGRVIARQVGHMTNLVDDLLDVSRVTRGQVELTREVFDLREAVRAAVEQVRPLAEARAHSLAVRVEAGPLWVDGDRTRLTQVVANLLNNAVKYTPPAGRVEVDAHLAGGRLRIGVCDDGPGIEPDLLPHVFELFTQGTRTLDRAQGGLGIGLALVRGLVELHGGRVEATSDGVGCGACFTVELPPAAPAVPGARSDGPAVAQGAGLSVVVVDDNHDAADTLALLLASSGHRVATHASAETLLSAVGPDGVDAFILDIGLPGMNGLELARRLRALPGGARPLLLALSGYGREEDRRASREAGFDAHFVKPVDGLELLDALRRRSGGA
ncbi:PAS domain-containing protein [Lysobacter sp. N42]|uniref:hybrid sensor histidine kinase/response regulator n=1 Tax=Lysobacter sp. N42 TaxID=2545719 RepID=UPI001044C61C|nr:PAS domain-containing protein [Lysobacter sp. N42]TCZ83633.1 PAS domain S-box protein [Lysobacter sp. N42]